MTTDNNDCLPCFESCGRDDCEWTTENRET